MSNKTMIKLAENFSMPAVDYANQANAILGIRKAGKSFTAMKTAEELMDCGIPILAIDPIGIWKYLKIGQGKHKGYPIVVAGGAESDILLTEHNCEEIVRAARKERISMVIDLHCRELATKATWRRIVHKVVELLMYENHEHGLLHVYLEEAAEFIPQRPQGEHAKVYSAIESMARMGRNVGLGLTPINQRAEEINKAVLEICEFSFLHKQVGKNSMLSVQKWLEVRQIENTKLIIAELPKLLPGECFVVGEDHEPFKIKVLPKKTFHPDPKKGNTAPAEKVAVDVTGFVKKMKDLLETKPVQKASAGMPTVSNKDAEQAAAKIAQLSRMLEEKDAELAKWRSEAAKFKSLHNTASLVINNIVDIAGKGQAKLIEEFRKDMFPVPGLPKSVSESIKHLPNTVKSVQKTAKPVTENGKLGKCSLAILRFLASHRDRSFTRPQIGVATGYSINSSGFQNSMSELNVAGLITKTDGRAMINNVPNLRDIVGDFTPQQYSIHAYKDKLSKCEREIYDIIVKYPDREFTKEELAQLTESNYSPTSSGYQNSLSTLNVLEIIRRSNGLIKLNPELKLLL